MMLLQWLASIRANVAQPAVRLTHCNLPCLLRLQRAGAVLVAKLATGEMAFDDVWWGGKVKNPWNLEEGSSGSSAGPAAAVVAGALPFAVCHLLRASSSSTPGKHTLHAVPDDHCQPWHC